MTNFVSQFRYTFKIYTIKNWEERRFNKKQLFLIRAANTRIVRSKKPLISVIIPTYNRAKILVNRTIPSVLNQTYPNFELIIVGDRCTDETEQLVRNINDSRIVFVNLSERGKYPKNPWKRYLVAGTIPRNRGLELASGEWIAPLDDDDEFSANHLEVLLNFAVKNQYEMVYGAAQKETKSGSWIKCGSYPPRDGQICHFSVLYHSSLKFMKYDVNSWKKPESDDWNMWRRMMECGVKIGFVNQIVGKHYREQTNLGV